MDGFRRGYKKSYRILYAEAYETAMDEKSSDGDYEDESGELTVSDDEKESDTSENEE
ncbi:hypothetical protein NEUTE2DRAFT_73381 [Neurospora tetrasperma FGSC 2509]|nr:hypothetical protein NEUTE2DRAFT_73381 [Neurospora tetrasperma FGSC 2509]